MKNETIVTSDVIEHALDAASPIDYGAEACFDKEFPTPEPLGKGSMRVIRVDEDIGFLFIRHEGIEDFVTTDTVIEGSFVKIGWVLNIGEAKVWIDGLTERVDVRIGLMLMSSARARNIFVEPPKVSTAIANLFISPSKIMENLECADQFLSSESGRMLHEPGGEVAFRHAFFDSRTRLALQHVERCPFGGSLQRLYLEGKALELSALAFASLQGPARMAPKPLRDKDRKCMLRVRDYIENNYCSPLSLREIAGFAGVSVAKLKRDYKRLFGRGIHQDIVTKRMDVAHNLIRRDGMSVKEAAYLCGYKSRIQFSSAFRSRFGGNPGDGAE